MLKDEVHSKAVTQLQEDLQFMLSSIRARQNTLIFYLERYKNSVSHNSVEFKLSKNEFQQKQKIYSRQISSILQKHAQFSFGNLYPVRAFWIKLKTIIKVSIERITGLGTPHLQKLIECYEKASMIAVKNSDSEKSLAAYKQVQNMLKKRTIQTLLLGRETGVSPSSISYSQSKIQKNRSQTLFKPETAISRFTVQNQESSVYPKGQTFTLISKQRFGRQEYLNNLCDIKQEILKTNEQEYQQQKIKSLNRIKSRRPEETIKANLINVIKIEQLGKLKSTSKAAQKYIKKINRQVDKYEKNFEGAFDGKYDVDKLLDKKKTIFENIYILYDDLFAKNIPNHKMISKFMFNTTKINQILYNAYEKKKKTNKKQKEKGSNQQNKEKKHKEKQKDKQKDKQTTEDKQKPTIVKSIKARKLQMIKEFAQVQIFPLHTSGKQHRQKEPLRQKKQSETTAITSKHHHKEEHHKNEKSQKQKDKQRQKFEKDKEKKIQRSKTAKIKLNSQIQNPHLHVLNHNLVVGKHFVSQHHKHNISKGNSGSGTQKLVKTIGL